MKDTIALELKAARDLCSAMLDDGRFVDQIARVASVMIGCFRGGGKVMLAGNGGSAADAQHLASELVSRFLHERPGLAAIALNANSSTMTAVANDYGYEFVFKRQIEALARPGDLFIGISTSGNSKNILAAAAEARNRSVRVIGLTGRGGGQLAALCDECLCVPSSATPHIQQAHILVGHILCLLVEQDMLQ